LRPWTPTAASSARAGSYRERCSIYSHSLFFLHYVSLRPPLSVFPGLFPAHLTDMIRLLLPPLSPLPPVHPLPPYPRAVHVASRLEDVRWEFVALLGLGGGRASKGKGGVSKACYREEVLCSVPLFCNYVQRAGHMLRFVLWHLLQRAFFQLRSLAPCPTLARPPAAACATPSSRWRA